jgi:choline monooxygenase
MAVDVRRSLPPIGQPLEEGWTLPASWYGDPSVFDAELEHVFARSWQYVGRADQAADPGQFFAARAGHVPVVVVRGRDSVLRGFVNVCRHRGHLVAEGAGCRETLQCPYHAWTYDLDGALRRAPRADREPGFEPERFSLLPVSVDIWGPFVFANPDPDAPSLRDTLGVVPELVAASGVDLARVRFHSQQEWPIEANWKVALENYLECYHCPVAHPGFSRVIDVDPDAYRLEVFPTHLSQTGPVRASALAGNGPAPYDVSGEVAESQFHFLWPSTTVNISPGPMGLSIECWVPDGPRRVLEVTDYFFAADVPEAQIAELIEWDGQVAAEDVSLVVSVQAGLDSGAVPQGRLIQGSELLIADFQRRVRDAVLDCS